MLALVPISSEIEKLYQHSKQLSLDLIKKLNYNNTFDVNSGTDLAKLQEKYDYVFIKEGVCKLYSNNKLLRFYSNNDIISLKYIPSNLKFLTEFSVSLIGFNYNESFSKELTNILVISDKINLFLLSSYVPSGENSDIELKTFSSGEKIILEGDNPDLIYEMISGKADVLKKDIKLGTISSGEIFGEISFLTDTNRSATVIAKTRCEVLIIKKSTFDIFIKEKPQFLFKLSKTLAKRVINLNNKVIF